MTRTEPWRRFEAKVDPDGSLSAGERTRRAKIAYRAFMRRIAQKSAKTRAAKKAKQETAWRRRIGRETSEELDAFRREQQDWTDFLIIWAAAQRGEAGIAELRKRQPERRDDCALCKRPFTGRSPDAWLEPRTGAYDRPRVMGGDEMSNPRPAKPDAYAHLRGLVGREIMTLTGKSNRILRLEGDDVIVGTRKSPEGRPVPIGDIQEAIDRLWRDGELEISVVSVGYRSAFVGAVLQTIPGAVATTAPRTIRLG